MDIVKNDADVASPVPSEPDTAPAGGIDTPSRTTSHTPTAIKSSPPVMRSQAIEGMDTGEVSPLGTKSDSEAETVVLPGANGHSPSKARREGRAIKLEDKSNESGIPENVAADVEMESDNGNTEGKDAPAQTESATSTLGKRKRTKNGQTANSSGLSSLPSSPVVTVDKGGRAKSLPAPTESDSDASKSPSSRKGGKEKTRSVDKGAMKADPDAGLEHEKERKRFRRQQSSGAESSRQQVRRSEALSTRGDDNSRKRSRSPSPTSRSHRRSVSSSATNGVTYKRKRVPAPLRATRDQASEEQSDSTSAGDSPHPQRSRTRNLATPPTGDSLNKMPRGKNAHHRTPLMNACDKGNLDSAKQYLKDNPGDLDAADPEGNTPLQCASLNGHADVVKMLLDAGCNIHTLNKERDSPLLDAVENGHLEVVKLLLAAGVNPKQRNRAGHEPIDKIRDDADDCEEIHNELTIARANWRGNGTYARPSVPVHSPHPEIESTSARNRRTQSHGRSTKTGDSLLYTSFDVNSLRKAAEIGDLEMVVNILNVLGSCNDVRSLIAAARGGHDEVLGMILGLTDMNPDPPPLKDAEWDHATPMLAAIGGDNIKVVELLLRNERFDPTKVYNRMTYPEWARQGKGPLWQEEERILQEALDRYKKPLKNKSSSTTTSPTRTHGHRQRLSDHSTRSNGSGSRDQGSNDTTHSRKLASSPIATATPVKRGPGRPRKEGRENIDAQGHQSVSHKEKTKPQKSDSENSLSSPEAELSKPRRKKLVSGKEMKEEQQSKHRRASFASVGSAPSVMGDTAGDEKIGRPLSGKKSGPRPSSSTTDVDISTGKSSIRSRKESDGKSRVNVVREDSPAKRARSSMTPPSSPRSSDGLTHKRRRIEEVNKGEARNSSSPDRRSHLNEMKQSSQPSDRYHGLDSTTTSTMTAKKASERHSPTSEEKKAAEEKLEAERKKAELEDKQAAEEAARFAEEKAALLAEIAAKEEAERKQAEENRIAAQQLEERQRAERLAKEEEERQQRQKEKEAEIARREEETKQRQLELERQRQEEREQRQREIERQRELQQKKREEEKRRKEMEEEAARLAKLPALLRWFDRCPKPATTEIASNFTVIQGVRYDTIRPEASGSPDAKEQWILNTQAALLLGEKDLQLSRYTAWEHVPVSAVAKNILWGLENSRYALLDGTTGKYNPEFWFNEVNGSFTPPREPGRIEAMRNEARKLFFDMDLTFVKLSDFMSVIHLHPHLKNLRMNVVYRELPPPGWTFETLVYPAKWKEDADAGPDTHGNGPFAPGTKVYINGNHSHTEEKAKYFQTSSSPIRERPEDRVPRRGFRQVFPHHADYTQLCIEQGLTHLLSGGTLGSVGMPSQNGVTPPASNASTNEEPRRPSDTSSVTQAAQDHSNGTNGTL